ncbi:TonB-dependent receptor plug domain-containing protein [Aquimarina sp. 2201CG14-23]|uniref:TonB-dependent receptor plug domain-containing protein n=1 Tax=Aquimarina mycalae TaxID=3040073 RepID=UPI002477FE77|nr:carboxypeptidase-like regulatory domain-containing protein [Aquimarina sp. 2201CG14-23]MDH7444730.1 TonB-dependent receptor [Aquimarina sp. 2201CG14-23]
MIQTKILVSIILLTFILSPLKAQTGKDTYPLIVVLKNIQKKFGYRFSYVDQELNDITIPKPPELAELDETILYLETTTPFRYTILKDNTITLSYRIKEICGTILDLNNKIIPNATIKTNNHGTISDAEGRFRIKIDSPNDIIIITYIGYKPLRIPILDFKEKPCKKIILTQKVESLNEIILNDYLIKGIQKRNDGSVTVNYNNFGILPGLIEPDLLQTIQALPGVLSVNETVSDINVRGGTNDQNLILWDGIKMYQSSHFFGLISAFNPYLTKNVQIFKNGSSSRYGEGVSSVIAMNTTNEINENIDASIGVNLISADGYIDAPLNKKSSIQLAVRHSLNEIIETPTYDRYFDKAFQNSEVINMNSSDEKFSFYDASIRWLYQFTPKDLIKVNALVMRNNLVFQEDSSINQSNISRESSAKQSNIVGGILYQRDWNKFFKSELLLYGTNYKLTAINSDIQNNQRLLQENDVLESGLKLNTLLKTGANTNLKNGYQFNETGISNLQDINNPTFRDFTKEVVRTHSIFSELEYRSNNSTTYYNIGARLNYFEKFDTFNFEPRVSAYKRFTNHFTLEFLGEIKSQATSQIIDLQNDFLGIENRRWVLSNDNDIPIIKSKQASIGISYNHNNWLISTDFYYKDVDGIITRSQGFQNQYEFIRDHGSYAVFGIDFLINKRFKSFSTWLSYSYANNEYTFNNLSETNFPNNIDIRHNINFAISYQYKNLKISGGINWHSGKPTTLPDPNNTIENNRINYLTPNNSRLDDYIRTDISSTYSFNISKKIKGFAGISFWNILGQNNTINNYYSIRNQNDVEQITESGLGTTPNLVLRLNF